MHVLLMCMLPPSPATCTSLKVAPSTPSHTPHTLLPPHHNKVSYKLANDAFKIALSNADAHAVNFLSNMAQLYSEKIRTLSHHVTHLTLVESDKHAIKEFDRKLQEDVVSFAMAVGLESTLPNRLVQGAMSRLTDVSNSMLNTATWGLDNGSMCSAHSAFKNNELGS